MAATVTVVEATDAGPNWNTVTAIRFCTADEHNPGTSYPIPIPAAGNSYSYWKSVALNLAGEFTKINNVRFYCDGTIAWTMGTGGYVRVGTRDAGDCGCPDGDYEQSAGTEGTTGYALEDGDNGHDYFKGQTNPEDDVTDFTSGAPMTVDSTDHTEAERTKHVVLQVKIADDATQGDQANETFTWKYDEI